MKPGRLITVLALACSPAFAAPRTFVSALTGVDTNPCTRAAPCRGFAAAVLQTDIAGEVVALDSGGYGPVTISYAMSIVAPSGVYAGITAFSGDAITVSSTIGFVILKNLFLNSQGGSLGIDVTNVRSLYVEGCSISGFSEGILFNPTDSDANLYVKNSVIRRSTIGIYLLPSTAKAVLESVRLVGNDSGVEASNGELTIRKSVAEGPGLYGFRGESNSRMTIEDSVASGNTFGYFVNAGALMFLTRCTAASNTTAGVQAQFTPSAIYVSDSTISENATGISTVSGGIVVSRCTDVLAGAPPPCPAGHFTNTLALNGTNGAFSFAYSSN